MWLTSVGSSYKLLQLILAGLEGIMFEGKEGQVLNASMSLSVIEENAPSTKFFPEHLARPQCLRFGLYKPVHLTSNSDRRDEAP